MKSLPANKTGKRTGKQNKAVKLLIEKLHAPVSLLLPYALSLLPYASSLMN